MICVAGCGLHAFKVFGLRLPALPTGSRPTKKLQFQEPSYGQIV